MPVPKGQTNGNLNTFLGSLIFGARKEVCPSESCNCDVALSLIVFLALQCEQLGYITENMNSVAENFMLNEVRGTGFLQQPYRNLGKVTAILSYISFLKNCQHAPLFKDWVKESLVGLPLVPNNNMAPVVYKLMNLLINSKVAIIKTKKSVADYLFLHLFNIQTDFCICESEKYKNKVYFLEQAQKAMISLITLHRSMTLNIQQPTQMFPPSIIDFNMSTIIFIFSRTFVQIKNDHHHLLVIIQSTLLVYNNFSICFAVLLKTEFPEAFFSAFGTL